MNKKTKKSKKSLNLKAEDFYYEPWHPSMDKPLTEEEQKRIEEEDEAFFEYLRARGEKLPEIKKKNQNTNKRVKLCKKKCTTN